MLGAGLDPARIFGGRTNALTGRTGTTIRAVRKGRPEFYQYLEPLGSREHRTGSAGETADCDAAELLARVLIHIPDPRRHLVRTYGAYSSVVRARRRAVGLAGPQHGAGDTAPTDPDRRALRRLWVALIRRIYEVDPLVRPRCGGTMCIIAFITEPRVIGTILRHLAAKGRGRAQPTRRRFLLIPAHGHRRVTATPRPPEADRREIFGQAAEVTAVLKKVGSALGS